MRSARKPENIREFVWKIIDSDISLKKDISRDIINVRALAKFIIEEHKLDISVDSVISAIRRYHVVPAKRQDLGRGFVLLKKAKIKTTTRMAAISLKKNEDVTRKLGLILPKVNYEAGEVLRILEGAKMFRLIVDLDSYPKIRESFRQEDIIETKKSLGMIEMTYPDTLQTTPGVFSIITTELSEHDISIIDALICSNEHILIVDERKLLVAFEILYGLSG
ncbi:MAG: hypothetical protein ABIC95_05080 [archaeon]